MLSILDQSDVSEFRHHISRFFKVNRDPPKEAFQKILTACNKKGCGYEEFTPITRIDQGQYVKKEYNASSHSDLPLTWLKIHTVIKLPLISPVEACVAELLTHRTLDLEVRGSSLSRRVVSLDKELYSTLSLFTQMINGYRRHTDRENPAMD